MTITKQAISFLVALLTVQFAVAADDDQSEGKSPLFRERAQPSYKIESLEDQPIPRHFKDAAKKQFADMTAEGHFEVDENEVIDVEELVNREILRRKNTGNRPDETPTYRISPSHPIGGSAHDATVLLEGPSGTQVDGGWTGINRVFSVRGLGKVYVEEFDYVLSNGSGGMIREFINADVNGNPAIYLVKKTRGGKWSSELAWMTDNKRFFVIVSKQIKMDSPKYRTLLDFARSLN